MRCGGKMGQTKADQAGISLVNFVFFFENTDPRHPLEKLAKAKGETRSMGALSLLEKTNLAGASVRCFCC